MYAMKYLAIFLMLLCSSTYGQLTMKDARNLASEVKLGSYSYHEQFIGFDRYGAPMILTSDGGAAFFGDSEDSLGTNGTLVKFDRSGKEEWRKIIRPQFDNLESQSVVQDKNGNYYVFMISYDEKRYRGGSQRIICLDKQGAILWDKTIGAYEMINNPVISYIRALPDGQIYLRGHIAPKKPAKDKDPEYRYWEGWFNSAGKLTQKTGDVIVWENKEWQKRFSPDEKGGK
jgi:hypothetical protein